MRNYKLVMTAFFAAAAMLGWAQPNFVVTSTNDPTVPGSTVAGELRWAINQANAAAGPSIISFNISGTGPFTIQPKTTLPTIVKVVYIDGTTQPGYDFNRPWRPMIIIDGTISSPLSQGLAFSSAPGSRLSGICVTEFTNGVSLTSSNNCELINNVIHRINQKSISLTTSSFCIVQGNYINTDSTLGVLSPQAVEGIIFTQSNDNIIGGTQCGQGNTIAHVTSEGIDNYPVTGQRNLYSGNRIFGCTLNEIFLRTTGNGGKTSPTITTPPANSCVLTGTSQANDLIQIFGSSGPVTTKKNARVYMASTIADGTGAWTVTLADIQYPFVTATATNSINNTSELALTRAITKDTLKLDFAYPATLCKGEEIEFSNTSSVCKGGLVYSWDFGDGSAGSYSSTHTYATVGTFTVTLSVAGVNGCPGKTKTKVITIAECGEFDCDTVPPPCNLSATIGPLTPSGGTTCQFTVTPSGGTGPYTYLWFDQSTNLGTLTNATTATVTCSTTPTPLPGAGYEIKVTVTDSTGCSFTKWLKINAS